MTTKKVDMSKLFLRSRCHRRIRRKLDEVTRRLNETWHHPIQLNSPPLSTSPTANESSTALTTKSTANNITNPINTTTTSTNHEQSPSNPSKEAGAGAGVKGRAESTTLPQLRRPLEIAILTQDGKVITGKNVSTRLFYENMQNIWALRNAISSLGGIVDDDDNGRGFCGKDGGVGNGVGERQDSAGGDESRGSTERANMGIHVRGELSMLSCFELANHVSFKNLVFISFTFSYLPFRVILAPDVTKTNAKLSSVLLKLCLTRLTFVSLIEYRRP